MKGQPASIDTGHAGPPCQNLAKYLPYKCEIKVLDKSECLEKHSLLAVSALEGVSKSAQFLTTPFSLPLFFNTWYFCRSTSVVLSFV